MLLASKKDTWFILDVVDNSDFKLDIKNFLDKIDDKSVRLTILAGCMVIYQMGYITRLYNKSCKKIILNCFPNTLFSATHED